MKSATANQKPDQQDDVDLDGPPLVLGNPAFTDVTDKVAEIIERKTPPGWLMMLAVAMMGLGVLGASLGAGFSTMSVTR